jgi:S1-C subfamily serine protease
MTRRRIRILTIAGAVVAPLSCAALIAFTVNGATTGSVASDRSNSSYSQSQNSQSSPNSSGSNGSSNSGSSGSGSSGSGSSGSGSSGSGSSGSGSSGSGSSGSNTDPFGNGSSGSNTDPFGNGSGSSGDLGNLYNQFQQFFGDLGGGSSGGSGGSGSGGSGSNGSNGYGYGGLGNSGSGSSGYSAANSSESTGVVLINTDIGWGEGAAAGTGLVLSSDGLIVTNHHVIADSTSIKVTDPSTGKTYTADVVGYDKTKDVAVLKLENASGLQTVTTDTNNPSQGDSVTGVGNAEGTGTLSAADGQVIATGQNISVSDDNGGSESLTNLIEVSSDIVPGDSGGALLDSNGDVIGMNVAASSGGGAVTGYAIPVSTVLSIANQIEGHTNNSELSYGYGAALGVQISSNSTGALVAGVVSGEGAANAGVTQGSTITSIGNTKVSSITDLTGALAKDKAGDSVSLTWTDSSGASHKATVTLGRAPVA